VVGSGQPQCTVGLGRQLPAHHTLWACLWRLAVVPRRADRCVV